MTTDEQIQAGVRDSVAAMRELAHLLAPPMHVARLLAADSEPVSLQRLVAAGGWPVQWVRAGSDREVRESDRCGPAG